jgi:RHS repeat-associated protein
VDDDWQPSTVPISGGGGGIFEAGPLLAVRTTPFNSVIGDGGADYPMPQQASINFASLCGGGGGGGSTQRDTEGIRRINELYLGDGGRYAYSNRSVLEKRAVQQLPKIESGALYASLGAGRIALAPENNPKGFRWIDKSGDWIDYNTQGQVVAWGDRNNNMVWLLRDTDGILRGVADANGRVLYSLHYTGQLVTEVRDYPISGLDQDLQQRSVKYRYDNKNRLAQVTDARGFVTQYDYDPGNRLIKITDQESHLDQIVYGGDTVTQRIAADGAVTDYEFEYDDVNKQFSSRVTDPETAAGRRVTDTTHNRIGKLVRQIVNGRTDAEVLYDTGARAEINTNARGYSTKTIRNEFDQVVEVDYPDGGMRKWSYSALHLGVTEQTDELGVKTQYKYDDKGNLMQTVEAVGTADARTTDYEVNGLGQIVKVTRRGRTEANGTVTLDAAWQTDYDAQGQIKKTTDPEGKVRLYTYNRAGNLVSSTDPLSHTTIYEVDALGNLTKTTGALGRTRSYQYDKVGNVIKMTDARAKDTLTAYDQMNRRKQITNQVGGGYKLQFNGQGLVVSETDEDGRINRVEFDNFQRLSRQIDGMGNVTEYGYNIEDGSNSGALGSLENPTEIKYPTFIQQRRYDQRERPTNDTLLNTNGRGTENLGRTAVYDKHGQIKSMTDANGKSHSSIYDRFGNSIESTDSLGNKIRTLYDVRGNVIQVTDSKNHVYKYEFDRNDRVIKTILPLGQATTYQYDDAGNPMERIDANGSKSIYRFDFENRLAEIKQYKAGNILVRTITYAQDFNNNLTGWSDTDHILSQTTSAIAVFDDANRKTSEKITYPFGNSLSYGYAYSLAGYKTQLIWPDSTHITYGYSQHGVLESVTIPGEGGVSVSRYKWTVPEKITLPGGSTQNKTYDALLNLEGFNVKTAAQQSVLSLANTFGKELELKQGNRTDTTGDISTTKNSNYIYDDEIRLSQTTIDVGGISDVEIYTLDGVANRIAHSKQSGAWIYDDNNRLMQRGSGTCGLINVVCYDYDAAGNQVKKTEGVKITKFGYNATNQLVEVKDGADQLIARYGYDPLNRRIWKERYRDIDDAVLAQAKRIYYLYADEGLIAEANQEISLNPDRSVSVNSDLAILAQYGLRPNAAFTTGVLFIKTKNSNDQDIFAYYHHDHLNTPIQATDKQGNVVWAANYEAFGKAQITTPASTAEKPTIMSNLGLPGQYYDQETGLNYNYNRNYDSLTGRYLQSDPIGLSGGINNYAYVDGNPIRFVDPTGLSKFDEFFGLPKAFWNWAHKADKGGRGYDYAEQEAKDLFEEWTRLGKPKPDNKGRFRQDGAADLDLLGLLIPWWLTPSEIGCSDLSERCIKVRKERENQQREKQCP